MNMNRFAVTWLCAVVLSTNAFSQSLQRPEDIVVAYKAAHTKQDKRTVMSLVSFQGASPEMRASWEREFLGDFSSPLKSITLVPLSKSPFPAFIEDVKKRLRPSVNVVSLLAVEFSTGHEGVTNSQVYVVGTENHAYFIVGP